MEIPRLEYLVNVNEGDEGEPVDIDVDYILQLTQQTVLLLGKTLNTATYHRRCNALSVLMPQSEVKNTLKEKAEILGKKLPSCRRVLG